jgi:hypothetical protein
MAARFPGLIGLALGVCLRGSAVAAQETRDSAGSAQFVTGEILRRAGATRLADVLLLAGGWQVSTVDGFSWHASPLGGSPFRPARWIVLVDGRRMDVDLFGSTSLDRLGIPLDQISRVDLMDFPRLEAGRITTEGIVHIHTARPAPGPSANGEFTTSTEIGDPGPFAFTPEASPNVDRNGHDASAGLGYGGGSWFAAAALGSRVMVPTDPAIVERYVAALGGEPRLDLTAVAAQAGASVGGGRHELTVRHSNVGDALGLRSFGTEIAARERYTQIGLAGRVPASGRREVSYDISHAVNRARSRRGGFGPALDWRAGTTEARLQLTQRASPLHVAGVRLRRLAVDSPNDPDLRGITLATAYAELGLGATRDAGPVAAATVTFGEREIGWAALLTRRWALTPTSRLEGAVTYERTVRAEDNSIWAWTERGYRLLADAGAEFEVIGSPHPPERIAADAQWSSRLAPAVIVSARALFRRDRSLSLERRRLHFVREIETFEGPTAIVHGAAGEHGGGSVGVDVRAFRGLGVRLSYWYRGVLGGDSLFREVWATVPRHGARLMVEYVPVPGLELWMAASYRGMSRWAEFESVEVESGGRYSPRLADAVAVDVAIQKWLWDERLRAHFGIRNLLGADLRYYPAGATFAPAAMVQVEARLP